MSKMSFRLASASRPVATTIDYARAVEVVQEWLKTHPGRRPHVEEIADAVRADIDDLRASQRHAGLPRLRDALSYACVYVAYRDISAGTKVDAALRCVGLSNRTSFNRRCMRYFGDLPTARRGQR